jgi:hypothetical protein
MHTLHRRSFAARNAVMTLGDAIAAVSAVAADEREVVAVVQHMLRRRSIRLVGAVPVLPRATEYSSADEE